MLFKPLAERVEFDARLIFDRPDIANWLHLGFRGAEINDDDQSNQMEMASTAACVTAKGGSVCVGANPLRAETFTKLHVDYVDPAPCAYQVLFVQSKQRDGQDHTCHNSDTQSRA